MSQAFPPSFRIKKKSDFIQVMDKGRKLYSKHFLLFVLPSELSHSRLGLTITKKVDPRSVGRNRIKRLVREIFRKNHHTIKSNIDIVVVARREAQTCELPQVTKEILGTLKYHGYLT